MTLMTHWLLWNTLNKYTFGGKRNQNRKKINKIIKKPIKNVINKPIKIKIKSDIKWNTIKNKIIVYESLLLMFKSEKSKIK